MDYWIDKSQLISKSYACGYCGENMATQVGYQTKWLDLKLSQGSIYICHFCACPTYFNAEGKQTPSPKFGNKVNNINNKNIEQLYDEARTCYSVGAYTSAVMDCRKLLMNIAVIEGADEGLNFIAYVNFLESKNYIPSNGKPWVDKIRSLGNEATHQIAAKSEEEANLSLTFIEMLLRLVYEMPAALNFKNGKLN